jgi:hypothetical protein
LLGIAVLSTFSIALTARPTSAENFICDVIDILSDPDCVAPATPSLDSPEPDAFLPSNGFNFSWQSVEDPSGVSYVICVASNESFAGAVCSDPIAETSYPAASLVTNENQTKFWRVMAEDGAGNASAWSEARTFTIDIDLPVITFSTDKNLVGGTVPIAALVGTVDDAHLTRYEVTITDPSLNSVVAFSEDTTNTHSDVAYNFDATGLQSGVYVVSLSGTDKAGHIGRVDVSIEVDNTAPSLDISGGDVIIKGGSITPEVTASDPHGVISYAWTSSPNNPGSIDFDPTVAEPEFTPTVEGSYSFALTVTDELGNTSSQSFEFGYAADLPPLPLPSQTQTNDTQGSPDTPLPAAVSPTANQTRDPREETDSDNDGEVSQVLGASNNVPGDPIVNANTAALTPTSSGWKILGILWYWWLVATGAVIAAWLLLKRFVVQRVD